MPSIIRDRFVRLVPIAALALASLPDAQLTYDPSHPVLVRQTEQFSVQIPVTDSGAPLVIILLSQLVPTTAAGFQATITTNPTIAWATGIFPDLVDCFAGFYSEVQGNVEHEISGDASFIRFEGHKEMDHLNEAFSTPGEEQVPLTGYIQSEQDDTFPFPPGWAQYDVPFELTAAINRLTVNEFSITRTVTQFNSGGLVLGNSIFIWALYEDVNADGFIDETVEPLLQTDTILVVSGTDASPEFAFLARDAHYVLRLMYHCSSELVTPFELCGLDGFYALDDLLMTGDGTFELEVESF